MAVQGKSSRDVMFGPEFEALLLQYQQSGVDEATINLIRGFQHDVAYPTGTPRYTYGLRGQDITKQVLDFQTFYKGLGKAPKGDTSRLDYLKGYFDAPGRASTILTTRPSGITPDGTTSLTSGGSSKNRVTLLGSG